MQGLRHRSAKEIPKRDFVQARGFHQTGPVVYQALKRVFDRSAPHGTAGSNNVRRKDVRCVEEIGTAWVGNGVAKKPVVAFQPQRNKIAGFYLDRPEPDRFRQRKFAFSG